MSPRERASYSNLMSLMSLVIGDSNFRDNTKKRKKPFAAGRFPISRSETVLLAGRIITIVNIIILLLLLLPRVPPHHSFRFIFFFGSPFIQILNDPTGYTNAQTRPR